MSGKKNEPFLLKPAEKDYIWGGTRLSDDFTKEPMEPLAETWECSTHPDGECVVAETGELLSAVLKRHPEYLGTHPKTKDGQLPILVKLIDADKDLSVQVHPDDEFAAEYENGQNGKTEFWYVVDSLPDASLVYGFSHDVSETEVRASIENGTIEKDLQRVPVQKDDVFWVWPGTVHAIGAGALIAEVQQSSNLTYRLYDYDRVDKHGNRRELHVDKALKVAKLSASKEPRQPMRVLNFKEGCAMELLGRCEYFQVHRMLLNTERHRQMAGFKAYANSFRVLLCVDGCGSISWETKTINFFRGDCVFVPADSVEMKLHGKAQLLMVEA